MITPVDITLLQEDGTVRTFERGIGAHATSDIYFDIEGMAVDTFSTYFGIDQEVGKGESSVRFAFYKDAEEIAYDGQDSEMLEDTPMKEISFSVQGAKELRLFADAGTHEWSDHVSYGDAKFTTTFEEKPQTEPEELSTKVLEYALELAAGADTEGVISSVVDRFNKAVANGQDILDRVNAGDTTVTQEMIDQSWKEIITVMQYLSFKAADKADLQKVIEAAEAIDTELYLEDSLEGFADALAAAKEICGEELASQEEANTAWQNLLKEMSELRLKPNKDLLGALIQRASALDENVYDAESFGLMRTALAVAETVYADDAATKEQVKTAVEDLQSAMDGLVAAVTAEDTNKAPEDIVANAGGSTDTADDSNTSTGSTTAADNTADNSNTTAKSAKTGDAANLAGLFALSMISAAVLAVRKRKMK